MTPAQRCDRDSALILAVLAAIFLAFGGIALAVVCGVLFAILSAIYVPRWVRAVVFSRRSGVAK